MKNPKNENSVSEIVVSKNWRWLQIRTVNASCIWDPLLWYFVKTGPPDALQHCQEHLLRGCSAKGELNVSEIQFSHP